MKAQVSGPYADGQLLAPEEELSVRMQPHPNNGEATDAMGPSLHRTAFLAIWPREGEDLDAYRDGQSKDLSTALAHGLSDHANTVHRLQSDGLSPIDPQST